LSPGLQENAARYFEAIADSNGFSKDRFEYFRDGKTNLAKAYPGKVHFHLMHIIFKIHKKLWFVAELLKSYVPLV
jgi:hypothetical protein